MKKTTTHNQFIRCLENIQDLSLQKKYNYAILLAGGSAFSRKTIKYNPKTKKYTIINHIDESKQSLNKEQIMNKSYTNIGKAILLRSLIVLID